MNMQMMNNYSELWSITIILGDDVSFAFCMVFDDWTPTHLTLFFFFFVTILSIRWYNWTSKLWTREQIQQMLSISKLHMNRHFNYIPSKLSAISFRGNRQPRHIHTIKNHSRPFRLIDQLPINDNGRRACWLARNFIVIYSSRLWQIINDLLLFLPFATLNFSLCDVILSGTTC